MQKRSTQPQACSTGSSDAVFPAQLQRCESSSKPTLQYTILIRAKGRFFRQTLGSGEINEDHTIEERAKILTKIFIYAIIYY
ncbi:hypothetical protein B0W20_06540 [Bacillus spizizenii]|nr:hypothetical protein B0W20_06540 [Bacillus spizizenii]